MAGKLVLNLVMMCLLVRTVELKPVDKRGPPPIQPIEAQSPEDIDRGTGLEYDRYLRQIVEVLESDDEFRKKLETANISDIKSGAIAKHLDMVNMTIRTKLDEIKRMEVQRLQELARIRMRSMKGVNRMDIPGHLDLRNPHSFEMKDLENLIKKTTHDLEKVDEMRREDFKKYEMEKEFEYQGKLKNMPEEERKQFQEQHEKLKAKHADHEKVNHPGSKDQFEEVWEKDDKLDDQEFDPRTFFMKHDLNGDRFWDIQEVEAVLQRELDKVYDARNKPEEDDPVERQEEMNRMREHVFTEIDQDKDFMISYDEFIQYTGKHGENEKFKEDEGWETVDEKAVFTDEELGNYIRAQKLQPGMVHPPVDSNLHFSPEEQLRQQQMMMQQQGMGVHPGMGQPVMPQQGMPQMGMPHQGMPQQGMPQQGMPQQGMPQQGMPQQGMPQQGMPQQGMPHQGMPQQGMPQQGIPQQGMPQQGMPQQGMPQQGMPQQQQQQFNQQQFNQQQQLNQQQQQFNQQQQQLNQQQQFNQQQQQLNQQQQFNQQQQQLNQQQQFNQQQQQLNQQQQFNQQQQQQQQGQPIQPGQGQPVQGQGQQPVQGQGQQPVQGQQPIQGQGQQPIQGQGQSVYV